MSIRLSDRVDPYIGSIGHLLSATQPLVYLPHAMSRVRPILDETITDRYLAPEIFGFPLNRSVMMPDVGSAPKFVSGYDHDFECVRCYKGSVLLEDSGIEAEYTVTEHGAVYRFAYPAGLAAKMRVTVGENGALCYENGVLSGGESGLGIPHCCFAAVFSAEAEVVERSENALVLGFPAGCVLTVKVGISYIDVSQALDNLHRETDGLSFDAIADRVQEIWDRTLGRIEVRGGTDREKTVFYTALYRVHQRMINISEYGRYYSGFDRRVHTDPRDFYVEDGTWDTYRCMHPLQLLLEKERQEDMIASYLRQYDQCGHLPDFPHFGGDRYFMVGKHSAVMIWDAYAKGLRNFDAEKAWRGMVNNAENVTKLPWASGPVNDFDRCYFEKGFFPALPEGEAEFLPQAHPFERRQCVTATLETCYDDWCLAEFGKALGKKEAEKYALRAKNYRRVFNPATGFMSPRTADGKWVEGFDPKLSGGQGGRAYFGECNGWVYTMSVQHDIDGLTELLGGKTGLAERLDRMFTEQYGTSKFYFLGQFPDSTGLMGQFCMGNEPGFHIPYLYNFAGQPWKTQRKLREIMRLWFTDSPLGICGDEDDGAMSAWFVFSAMGFYPACPGRPEYELGSPLFEEICIHPENGRNFIIRAEGNNAKTKYVLRAELNGVPLAGTTLRHEDIVRGGTLTLKMGERPPVIPEKD